MNEQETMKVEISAPLIDEIGRYLSQMPYKQVAGIMNRLQAEVTPQLEKEAKKLDNQG